MNSKCPDTGACHHRCTTGCWRVLHCGPLSAAKFPDNRWPDYIREQNEESDGVL